MKKLLLTLTSLIGVMATAQTTATATLNVKLNPIMSIVVNNPNVTVEYLTEADYMNGKSVIVANHLTTFSTSGYIVAVKALSPQISSATDEIGLGDVTILAESNFPHAVYTPAVLSETPVGLIQSSVGGGRKNHNVTYSVDGEFWDRKMETYSVSVMYEITAL